MSALPILHLQDYFGIIKMEVGEYYWINESRNEVTFTISGNKGNINKEEAEAFTIDKDSSKIELTGSNIISLKENYTFKDGVFTVDISGSK